MHYVIIGAGAVGGVIGGKLHRHGYRATLVARGQHLAAIREHGLLLATPDSEERLDVPAAAGPDEVVLEPDSVLVLAMKSQDTPAALAEWVDAPVRGGGVAADRLPVLCAQNGVANERVALRRFARVYGVCLWLPATFLEPGTVIAAGYPRSGLLHIGRFPGGADGTAGQVAADLSASGFATRVRPDVMRWKYGKLLGNLANGPGALFETGRDWYGQVRDEGAAALAAAGIPHTTREEESADRGDQVQMQSVVNGRQRGGSSTWQSLARNAGSIEVDYLNGEIVLLGREHGVPTPVNLAVQRAMHRAVRDGIAPGEFPVDEFHALLRDAGDAVAVGASTDPA